MKSQSVFLCVVAACLFAFPLCAGEATKKEPIQPGAQGAAMVDAGLHDSLQAALEAVPEGGGVIRIPPGRYELSEAAVCRKGDVMIAGSGSATHLVNRNEEGEPAEGIAIQGEAHGCILRDNIITGFAGAE